MSNNSHFLAVDAATLQGSFEPEDILFSSGLSWCGDTFELGYAFRGMLHDTIWPFLSPELQGLLEGGQPNVTDPAVALLASNENGVAITAFTKEQFRSFLDAVRAALRSGDWQSHDNDDWQVLVDAELPDGDFYVLAEFE